MGILAELIEVEPKYQRAIEVALGAQAQNIVVSSRQEATEIIRFLKEKKIGRLTFYRSRHIGIKEDRNIKEKESSHPV